MAKEIIKLQYSIKVEGVETDTIELRRPNVRDIKIAKKQASGDEFDMQVKLVANLAGIRPEEAELIDLADFKAISEVMEGFFGLSETTV